MIDIDDDDYYYYYFDYDDDDYVDSFLKPYKKPNDCMVNCSMGPEDFDIFLKPYKKP
jgi:hypothetical protein